MKTMISDLPQDLIEEILSRVPITSKETMRSTCKRWNVLFNDLSFTNKHCAKSKEAEELLVVMVYEYMVCIKSFNNLYGIHNHKDPQPYIFRKTKISQISLCHGLLLCLTECDNNTLQLMVWNPYLGQVRWIESKHILSSFDTFAMGYDNNNNHKILRVFNEHGYVEREIYDFKSSSWKVVEDNTPDWYIRHRNRHDISLKGNTYFVGHDLLGVDKEEFLLCFDFTKERYGPPLNLPSGISEDPVILSTIREEQLAVLSLFVDWNENEIKIWLTTKIEPDVLSWRSFLKVDTKLPLASFSYRYGTFFVDEKQKAAMVCYIDRDNGRESEAYMIREDECYKVLDLEISKYWLNGCSYVPSSVQIQ